MELWLGRFKITTSFYKSDLNYTDKSLKKAICDWVNDEPASDNMWRHYCRDEENPYFRYCKAFEPPVTNPIKGERKTVYGRDPEFPTLAGLKEIHKEEGDKLFKITPLALTAVDCSMDITNDSRLVGLTRETFLTIFTPLLAISFPPIADGTETYFYIYDVILPSFDFGPAITKIEIDLAFPEGEKNQTLQGWKKIIERAKEGARLRAGLKTVANVHDQEPSTPTAKPATPEKEPTKPKAKAGRPKKDPNDKDMIHDKEVYDDWKKSGMKPADYWEKHKPTKTLDEFKHLIDRVRKRGNK